MNNSSQNVTFSGLSLQDWRQFDRVNIQFDSALTILTGANGAGKSTLLRLLAQHFGWSPALLGTPITEPNGVLRYIYRRLTRRKLEVEAPSGQEQVGEVCYSNGQRSPIFIPPIKSMVYNVLIPQPQPVAGLYISSHRPIVGYQVVSSIPTTSIGAEQAYQQYHQETLNRYNNGTTKFSPVYRMKEAIISMATFGPGNHIVQGNPTTQLVFENFQEVLRRVLPRELGFQRLSVRIPDIVMVTDTGEFVLDSASGGLMSIFDLAWQIFLYSQGKGRFVVAIDEPENHLHPSLQRSVIPNLISAFPSAQFIVATHSPFIVSAMKDASVYVLQYVESFESPDRNRAVSSLPLERFSKAGTASEILRSALGVPVTIPMWAETELRQISDRFNANDINDRNIQTLKAELADAGLAEFYPDALRQIASKE